MASICLGLNVLTHLKPKWHIHVSEKWVVIAAGYMLAPTLHQALPKPMPNADSLSAETSGAYH